MLNKNVFTIPFLAKKNAQTIIAAKTEFARVIKAVIGMRTEVVYPTVHASYLSIASLNLLKENTD